MITISRQKTTDGQAVTLTRSEGYYTMTGPTGSHSIAVEHTGQDRLAAHWYGFCQENGVELNDAQAAVAVSMAEVVGSHPETGEPITRAELRDAFDLVANRSNWKLPVSAIVKPASVADLAVISYAVTFFTGSTLYVVECRDDGSVEVEAAGYYQAVGA